jgi:hypothetical protein
LTELDVKDIEKAIDDYVKAGGEGREFVTGWILIGAVASSSLDNIGHNGYITVTSEGLPHHAQLGLLAVAQQDKQAGAMTSALYQISDAILGDDDEWDGDE